MADAVLSLGLNVRHIDFKQCLNEDCRKLFVPRRINQKFCCDNCGNRHRVNKHRDKKGLL